MTAAPSYIRSRWRPAGLGVLSLSLMVTGCDRQDEIDQRINAWMWCVECVEQQRQRVEELGNVAVPTLAVILHSLPPGPLENVRRQIIESYQPVTAVTLEQYVPVMLQAYIARSQIRSAVSLGDIGTARARSELERALAQAESRGYRHDVVRTISGALARATNPAFTGGTLTPTVVDFGDTVRVHAGNVSWDGNESIEVHGSPFGTELFLNRFDPPEFDDSLEFVAVGEVGSYAVSVTKLGADDVTQLDTTLRIRSLKYAAHTPATAVVFNEAALPQTRYLVLGSAGGLDTIDYVRVQLGNSSSLTAAARWPGVGNVHLAWRSCGGGGLGSFPGGSTVAGKVVDQDGNNLEQAVIRVIGTMDSVTTGLTGTFSIGGLPPSATTGGLVSIQVKRTGYHPRVFTVPAGTVGHVFGLGRPGTTPATAMSMTSSTVSFNAGDCGYLQVWIPPGKHQIIQLKVAAGSAVPVAPPVVPVTNVVVSPEATLLSLGQQAQFAANNAVTWASSNTVFATVDATGNVTGVGPGSSTITATLIADPSKKDSALVRVYPPAAAGWIITSPAAASIVDREGAGPPTVMLAAQAIGPTNTFPNPFVTAEFWVRPTGGGTWRRIGQMSAGSATLFDDGANRSWTYSMAWNPDATSAPFTTSSLTPVDLIAIGITAGGTISSSAINALLSVRVP